MKYFAMAAVALATIGFVSAAMVDTADARKGGKWSTTVTNPGGNEPAGQQDRIRTDGGWSTTVTNPGGNQPPGQQPARQR